MFNDHSSEWSLFLYQMKLGILLPTSKLYPSLLIDFTAGVRMAIAEFGLGDDVELVFESIHQGTEKNLILNAVNKLVLQHQTDANILFSNYLLLEEISSSLNALQKPLIVTNMGGNMPSFFEPGEFILSNSYGLWESAFLAAKWGEGKFGKKTAHGSYFYEAGYNLYSAFCMGLEEAEGEVVFNQISQFNPDPNDFENFEKLAEAESPDFLYALYSERDAVDFLSKLSKSEMNGKYPVVSSGVLLNDEIIEKVEGTPKDVFNIMSWDLSDQSPENVRFVETYEEQTGNKPNCFSLLGYECSALIFSAMKNDSWGKNGKSQVDTLKNIDFTGPRGKLSFDETNSTVASHNVYTLDGNMERRKLETLGPLENRNDVVKASQETTSPAGWFQPYLCQ